MIAGSFKSSLPRPREMAALELAVKSERFSEEGSAKDTLMVAFRHAVRDLMVLLLEQDLLA
jgi:hypothetical protein